MSKMTAFIQDSPLARHAGLTVNRFCSSGLQTIALAAQRIIAGEGEVQVAGGVESISCVQQEMNQHMFVDSWLKQHKPEIYWPMLQTAENVAKRYGLPKERMDAFGAESQRKACAAQAAGRFAEEIAPIAVTAGVADKVLGLRTKQLTVSADEGLREGTTVEAVASIRTAQPGGVVSAGNASQFSDGAGACVVVDERYAERHGLKPLGRFLGFAVAGCEPDEMGIGPVFAVPTTRPSRCWKSSKAVRQAPRWRNRRSSIKPTHSTKAAKKPRPLQRSIAS